MLELPRKKAFVLSAFEADRVRAWSFKVSFHGKTLFKGMAEQKDKPIPRTLSEALVQQVALLNFAVW